MPLYDFRCQADHVSQRLAPIGQALTNCDACGAVAQRLQVNHVAIVRTDYLSLDSTEFRQKTRLFREASAELEHASAQVEATTGSPSQGPDLWGQAKERANQMQLAGEARQPAPMKGL